MNPRWSFAMFVMLGVLDVPRIIMLSFGRTESDPLKEERVTPFVGGEREKERELSFEPRDELLMVRGTEMKRIGRVLSLTESGPGGAPGD